MSRTTTTTTKSLPHLRNFQNKYNRIIILGWVFRFTLNVDHCKKIINADLNKVNYDILTVFSISVVKNTVNKR